MTPSRHAAAGLAALTVSALSLGAVAVAPASAAASGAGTVTTTATPATYDLGDSGRTVHVQRGHLVHISLTTASDGGYRWVVVRGRHSPTFTIVSRKVVAAPTSTQNGEPIVGASTQTVYTLRARATGLATFKAIERRPFDKADVARRFTLHLRVTTGRTIRVERGHLVRISLTTATDGGYRWVVVRGRHSPTFTIVSRKVVATPTSTQNGEPIVGASTQTVYTLRARAAGLATFKAIERRPFDKTDVIRRYTLHLRVTRG